MRTNRVMKSIKDIIRCLKTIKHDMLTEKQPDDDRVFMIEDAIEYLYQYEDLRES